jgi:hypothetical protein
MGVQQRYFQVFADDGDVEAATALGAEGENIACAPATSLRVREQMLGTAGGYANFFTLFCDLNGGTAQQVTTTSSIVKLVTGTPTDDATTAQLLTGAEAFVAGRYDEDGTMTAITIAENEITECEWCVQIVSGDVSAGDVVKFYVRDNAGASFTNSDPPEVTVSAISFDITSDKVGMVALCMDTEMSLTLDPRYRYKIVHTGVDANGNGDTESQLSAWLSTLSGTITADGSVEDEKYELLTSTNETFGPGISALYAVSTAAAADAVLRVVRIGTPTQSY